MIRIPLTEAQLRLPELIASLQPGEEVQIFVGDVYDGLRLRTVARLIGELQPLRKPRQPGSAIGTLLKQTAMPGLGVAIALQVRLGFWRSHFTSSTSLCRWAIDSHQFSK